MTETEAWHRVGPAEELPDGALRRVEAAGHAVCVGRVDGGWVAFDDTCTHEECPLSDGELDGAIVVCPCHGSEFDVRTGDVLSPPALDPLPIYDVRVEGDALEVRLSPPAAAAQASAQRDEHVPVSSAAPTVAEPSIDGLALADIDLSDLDTWVEGVPHAWLALLRRQAPVHWQDEQGGEGYWSFTRYDDIVAVSKDFETYSSETGDVARGPDAVAARGPQVDARHRPSTAHASAGARQQGLYPKVVNAYELASEDCARHPRCRFEQDEFDWVENVAAELPMWVFSEIMALPSRTGSS